MAFIRRKRWHLVRETFRLKDSGRINGRFLWFFRQPFGRGSQYITNWKRTGTNVQGGILRGRAKGLWKEEHFNSTFSQPLLIDAVSQNCILQYAGV